MQMQSLLDEAAGDVLAPARPAHRGGIASDAGHELAGYGAGGTVSTNVASMFAGFSSGDGGAGGGAGDSGLRALGPFLQTGALLPSQAGGGRADSQRRRTDRSDRGENPKSRRLSASEKEASARGGHADFSSHKLDSATPQATNVCSLYLTTTDQLQCRFAVKNDEKDSNQALQFVQAHGYVEYKARYCKKRGNQSGYGHFHVAFIPSTEAIYPFMHVPGSPGSGSSMSTDAAGRASGVRGGGSMMRGLGGLDEESRSSPLLSLSDVDLKTLDRLEITVRLYQSFRGKFPVRLAKFGDDEMYHPLYITSWQDATLLKGISGPVAQTSVIQDPDGEYLKYVVQDEEQLRSLVTKEGVTFPCPVPTHPERLNDIGMLRMQVQIKLCHRGGSAADRDHTVWVKMKVVQQLSGKKRKFTNMLRSPSIEWALPPHPEFTSVVSHPRKVVRHVLGEEHLRGQRAMDLLLSLTADIAQQESISTGRTAFHLSCEAGNLGLVRMMLQHELSLIRIPDPEGMRPLHLAAKNGHTSIVQALLLAGARLETLTFRGETAADLARRHGFDNLGTTLSRHQTAEQTIGCENIFRAASIGRTACLKRLLSSQPMIDSCNPEGQTLLMLAALNNHPMAVSTLLDSGASIAIPDRTGDSVLLQAAARGFVDIVTILVHHDPACLTSTAADGSTALHRACARGRILAAQILITCGADVNVRDGSGQTAAEVATAHNHPCTAYLTMMAHGSDGNHPTMGLYPVSRSSGSLHHAAAVGDVVLVRRLLYSGAHPNKTDEHGDTPIKTAAKNGHIVVLDVLISSHLAQLSTHPELSDINVVGNDGDSPVHAACTEKSIGCLLVLLSSNLLKLGARSFGGDTALHRCAKNDLPVCAAFLLLAGGDPMLKDNVGLQPSDVARRQHHSATLQVLEASRKDLLTVSQTLEIKLGVPTGGKQAGGGAGAGGGGIFSWRGFDTVLSRIWHETHEVRKAARNSHQDARRSASDYGM
jgi:ankyrin repeat protein